MGGPQNAIRNTGDLAVRRSTLRAIGGQGDSAITNGEGGRVTIEDSRIVDMRNTETAGAIVNRGTMTIRNSVVSRNHGYDTGGIANQATGTMTIKNSKVNQNGAGKTSGASTTAGP